MTTLPSSWARGCYHVAMRSVSTIIVVAALLVTATAQTEEVDRRLEDVRKLAKLPSSARRPHLEARLVEAGVEFERVEYILPGSRGVSVEVTLGPEDGPAVLLTTHHDVRKGSKGANNNASGIAVLLDVVERLAKSPPPRRVVALFLDGGEMRLSGSRNWIEAHEGEHFLGVVNFEMCGRGDTVVLGPRDQKVGNALPEDALKAVAALDGAPPARVLADVPPTDHRTFFSAGLEVCALSMAPASDVAAIEKKFSTRRGPLPGLYRDAFTGLDRADRIRPGSLATAARAGEAIVRTIASRNDAGNPVVPNLRKRGRELAELLPTAKTAELLEAVGALGHRGAIPLLARLTGDDELTVAEAARKLLGRVLSGTELRAAVDPKGDRDAILSGYRGISRRMIWSPTRGAFELQLDTPADR